MSTTIDWTDQKEENLADLAEIREQLETLADSDLPIAEDCQRGLDRLNEFDGGLN